MSEPHDRLLRKLESIASLTSVERDAISELPFRNRSFPPRSAIRSEGERPPECCLVLDGLTCAYNVLPDGSRQITSFFVPGDLPDLQSLHLHKLDHSFGTISQSRLAFVSHEALLALSLEHPGVAMVLWRESLVTGCLHRQWVTNLGRRIAYARIAHLLCELYVRMRVVGLATEEAFRLDATQAEVGDATGLSPVHVNRVLQELRSDGLIVSQGRSVHVPDWGRLRDAAQFDPTYLHLTAEASALIH